MKVKFLCDVELSVTLAPDREYLTYGVPMDKDFEEGQVVDVAGVKPQGDLALITFNNGDTAFVCRDSISYKGGRS